MPSACIDSVGVLDEAVSRLNIPAHMPPVNAWPAPLRTHTHHSGPMWIATPSSYETFTHCYLAGFHRRTNAWPHGPLPTDLQGLATRWLANLPGRDSHPLNYTTLPGRTLNNVPSAAFII